MAGKSVLFAQANLGRGRCATPEFRQSAIGASVRIAMIQEPYQHDGQVRGWGDAHIVTGNALGEEAWACVAVFQGRTESQSLDVMKLNTLCSKYIVCA